MRGVCGRWRRALHDNQLGLPVQPRGAWDVHRSGVMPVRVFVHTDSITEPDDYTDAHAHHHDDTDGYEHADHHHDADDHTDAGTSAAERDANYGSPKLYADVRWSDVDADAVERGAVLGDLSTRRERMS